MTKKARIDYEKSVASEAKSNPKKFWKFAKDQTKTKQGISNLKDGEKLAESDEDKAEVLLKQFSSVFTSEIGDPPTFDKRDLYEEDEEFHISVADVKKGLEKLNVNKSAGPDGMHPRIFKELSNEIAPPLAQIFNKSLSEKKIPDDWRQAIISPIFKKGKRNIASNYRPVSLTSIASKLMESFIREQILTHMKKNNLLSNKQFGFLQGRSTVLQLLRILDEWTDILDNSSAKIDAIYLDFSKAFDTVPHKRLITKMRGYGINKSTCQWVEDFLSNREHRVKVNGILSSSAKVTSGIPQGSVLGPILFILYINDLPDEVANDVYLFADDTKIYSKIDNDEDCNRLQDDLDKMEEWSAKWLLTFNPEKCKVLHLGKKKSTHEYNLSETTIESSPCEKDLGVYVDHDLKFTEHMDKVVNKAHSIMGSIRRAFRYLDCEIFLKMYKGLVRPHLEYAVQVWHPYLKKDIKKVEAVQRRATSQIQNLKNMDYKDRLKKLKLPTLIYRRMRGDMIEVFKLLNKKYDTEVSNFLPLHRTARPHSSTRGHNLKLLKRSSNHDPRSKFFSNRVVDWWNSLPNTVVTAPSVLAFEMRLDKFWSNLTIKYDFDTAINSTRPLNAPGGHEDLGNTG
ncbi:MAG: reverse transcriptase family protein [Desulfobacteraceae bacterium]|nr:reverse transcriptase family protein [Desulfobacteraceae bacterium]